MSSLIDVAVPDIGDFESVEVIEIAVAVGDTVELEQTLLTLESDKASMDIPSSAAGVVDEILVKVGDSIAEGTVVVRLKQMTMCQIVKNPRKIMHQSHQLKTKKPPLKHRCKRLISRFPISVILTPLKSSN